MHYECLIVDDELAIAQSTSEYFNLFELSCAYVTGYEECLDFLSNHTVSLLLLDINLGDQSGFSLCKKLREQTDIPILFISARTSDDDILTALNIGGDDYIQKPYTLSILLAKVKAVLKRCQKAEQPARNMIRFQDITIDLDSHKLYKQDQPVNLREMEFKLLLYLVQNKNRVITKDELLTQVWPDPYAGEGTLTVHIRHLREKIEADPNHPVLIQTVWGVGYRMEYETAQTGVSHVK